MRRTPGWIVGATVTALAVARPGVAQQTVTLDEALDLARLHSPTVIQAQGDIRVAQASRRQSLGDWLPSLSGSSGWSQNSTNRFDERTQTTVAGSASSLSASLNASILVFDGFRRFADRSARLADLSSAEASLVSQEFTVALQTKQAFFSALAADELVRVSQSRITRAERQLQVARDRLAAGAAIRSDTLRSFVEVANAQLQLVNARTQLATASANLARLIGVDGQVRAAGDETAEPDLALDTAALRAEALDRGPGVQTTFAQARAADAQVKVTRSQYFPTVSASYSRSFAGPAIADLRNSWSARLSFSWSIFNGFNRETQVARSSAAQDAAYARIDDTRRQINAQLTQQFAAFTAANVRVDIAAASIVAAREDLRVQQERYRLGASTIVDVLNSQVNLDQAEVDIVQARLDRRVATAQIEALVGREVR